MGHISEKGLEVLKKQGAFGRDTISKVTFCEHCVLGKHHRLSFKTGVHKTNGALEYIHADLWGPAKTQTQGGNKYFLSLIDDYSRKVWVYLLKSKDETFNAFKNWKNLIENQSNKRVKVLRTDNGLEFCNVAFDDYCKEHGILRHRTVRYTPQQNGVAERMNRTLVDKVRCMLVGSGLPKMFWGEALMTACYIVNQSSSTAIDLKTPNEMWFGKPKSYSNMRVFGCLAYAHQNEGKLEPRAVKCVFLGYPEGTKGYRLWMKDSKGYKTIVSRDVVFKEDVMPCLSECIAETGAQHEESSDQFEVELAKPIESTQIEVEQPDTCHLSDEEQQQVPEGEEQEQVETHEEMPTTSSDYQLTRDRSKRQVKPTQRFGYSDFAAFALISFQELNEVEPKTYLEAIKGKQANQWVEAMKEELSSLKKNGTWQLVIFSPVIKYTTIRVMLVLAAHNDWKIEQMDVKTAFLHGDLEETIYMKQPEGFEVKGRQEMCALYLLLYVDDMLLISDSAEEIKSLKHKLSSEFDMKDIGKARRILGMEIIRNRISRVLSLKQSSYLEKVLSKFSMTDAKPTSIPISGQFKFSSEQCPKTEEEKEDMINVPYSSAVGSIINPGREHWEGIKWLLRYLLSSSDVGLMFKSCKEGAILKGYVDSDFAGDKDKRRSTTSYIFTLCDCCVSWKL
ncbi:hypothetical protein UlMin_012310 [Ulmus minor]